MLFTPHLLLVNEQKASTIRKPALFGQAVYVIPRGDCSFRRVRLSGSGREAKAAALMRARSEALPGEDGSNLVIDAAPSETPSGAGALMAGLWNFPTSPNYKGRYLPETLAQQPHSDGARIVRGVSGFEGQIWAASDLVASRWWNRAPTDRDWDGFIRAAQEALGALNMPRPAPTQVPWRDDLPIFDIDRERLSQIFSPRNLGTALAAGLLCGGFYVSGQYLRESLVLRSVESKTAELRSDTQQIQSERRRALTNMGLVKRYRGLGDNGTILAGLAGVANVLGQIDLGIERATYREGALELLLKGDTDISVPDVVTLLEAEPTLSNVSLALEAGDAIILNATLRAPQRPAPSSNTQAEQP